MYLVPSNQKLRPLRRQIAGLYHLRRPATPIEDALCTVGYPRLHWPRLMNVGEPAPHPNPEFVIKHCHVMAVHITKSKST